MSEEKIDWLARVEEARTEAQQYTKLNGDSKLIKAFCELINALSNLVDEYAKSEREYAVKAYVEEMFPYIHHVLKFDPFYSFIYRAVKPLVNATRWHPRLRLEVLKLWDMLSDRVLPHRSMFDTTRGEIWAAQRNIKLADMGVTDIRHYRTADRVDMIDPVEWTVAWDEAIDKAIRKTYAVLPKSAKKRGDNFQERFYETLARLLQADHGIVWRTPKEMKQVQEELDKLPRDERYPKPDPLEGTPTTLEEARREMHMVGVERSFLLFGTPTDEDTNWLKTTYLDAHLHYIDCCIAVTKDRRDEVRLQPYTEVTAAINTGLHTIEFVCNMGLSADKALLYEKLKALYDSIDVAHPRLSRKLIHALYILSRDAGFTVGDKEWLEAEKRYWDENMYCADKSTEIKPHAKAACLQDPIEWSEAWEKVIDEVDEMVEEELGEVHPNRSDYGEREWTVRARILAEKYDIVWHSPKDLNPDMTFNE